MADSNRNVKIVGITLALLLLLGGVAAASDTETDEEKKKRRCPKGYIWAPLQRKCIPIDDVPVKPGGDKPDPTTGNCPPGMIANAARLKALVKFPTPGPEQDAELAKYPECVPILCPKDHRRTEYGDCVPDCPQGMQWSPKEQRCMPSPQNCPPGEQWSPTLLRCLKSTPTDPTEPGTDPKEIPEIIKNFPEGDNFYQSQYGDVFEGTKLGGGGISIAYAYLRREAFLAAREFGGLDDAAAMQWAGSVAKPYKAYMAAFEILLCAGTNDACYGTYGYCGTRAKQAGRCRLPNGTFVQNHAGKHGRAIQLEPKHPDNLGRLLNGQNLARGVTLGNPARAGDGTSNRVDSSFDSLPALWCPKLDRKKLWDSKGKTIEITPETWSDGTTRGWPPPIVIDRFLSDYADTGRKAWGCMKMELEGE